MTAPLFNPGPRSGQLTAHQTLVLEALRERPLTPLEAHQLLDRGCRFCMHAERYGEGRYCYEQGHRILEQLVNRQLAVRRNKPRRYEAPGGYGHDPATAQVPY